MMRSGSLTAALVLISASACLKADIRRSAPSMIEDGGSNRSDARTTSGTDAVATGPDVSPEPPDGAREDVAVAADLRPSPDLRPVEDATPPRNDGAAPTSVRPTQAGQVVITEIMVDTDVVADDFGEWFELHNPSKTQAFDLNGCTLQDEGNSHRVTTPLLLAPGAHVTLAIFDPAAPAGFRPDYWYMSELKFGNEGDSVRVICSGTLIDQVDYSRPGFDRKSGRSLSLDPDRSNASDNDLGTSWCRGGDVYNQAMAGAALITDQGSPGKPNPRCR